jgi:hypothetical protein
VGHWRDTKPQKMTRIDNRSQYRKVTKDCFCCYLKLKAVARFGLSGIENPRVGGSIPPPGTIRFNDLARLIAGFFVSGFQI